MTQLKNDFGIGHNSNDTPIHKLENIIKFLLTQICNFADNHEDCVRLAHEARYANNKSDRIESGYQLREKLEDTSFDYEIIKIAYLSNEFGNDVKLEDRPEYKPVLHRNYGDRFFDEPLGEMDKFNLTKLNNKDFAEYIVKKNAKAWNWYNPKQNQEHEELQHDQRN